MGLGSAPVLPLAAALAAGIAVAPAAALPTPVLIAAAAALMAAAAALLAAGLERATVIALLAGLAAVGALRESSPALPADHVARQSLPMPVTIEGRLAAEPVRWAPDRARLVVEVDGFNAGAERRPATGRVQITVYGEAPPLGEGQRIAAEVRLHRPVAFRNPDGFDYPAQLRREGILLVGSGRGDRVTALSADVPPWPVRVKRWAVETIRSRLPETSAALLTGLLLGERAALPRETDDNFRRAGVYHILAVSGFNVALLAASVFATLALLGVPRRATALCAATVLVGFALVVGGQPSVLRATVMGLLLLSSILLERESQVMNALAVAALLLLLWSPADLREPGFQLSFAATAGIIYLGAPLAERLHGLGAPRWLATAAGVSLGAQLAVTPVMLLAFNQLSLIGVVANLFVVPMAAPATTLGMVALLVALASETLAGLVFDAVWLILVALRGVAWLAAAVPGAMVHLPAPPWGAVAAWYGALLLAPRLGAHRIAAPGAAALGALAVGLAIWPWVAPGDGRLRVTFLDVGQGDAALIELPEGPRLLVDGGPGGVQRFDVGERVIAPLLWNRPARALDVVALTHSDMDHAGGLAAILRLFTVREFWEGGTWTSPAEETRQALLRSGAPRRLLRAGDRLWAGQALITVLNPDADARGGPNDESLVLRLEWRGVAMLLTGDLGADGEDRLRGRGAPLRALVLKVGHHGSRFSSTAAFLEGVRPALAVVSVGARNPFRHPTAEALGRLETAGARVYRTDRDGAVIVETDGARLWVTRWARRTTEVFDLDPERPADGPSAPDLDGGLGPVEVPVLAGA